MPKLYEDVKLGKVRMLLQENRSQKERALLAIDEAKSYIRVQKPSLFDFTRKRAEVVLVRQ